MAKADPYPEHTKLAEISDKSQAIGEFVDWLRDKGISLCRLYEENGVSRYYPQTDPIRDLLADYYDIDQNAIEREKRAMLDELRAAQGLGPLDD